MSSAGSRAGLRGGPGLAGLLALAAVVASLSLAATGGSTAATSAFATNWPGKIEHWFNDFASLLPAEDRERLDARLRAFQERTGNHIVVAILTSLEGDSIERLTIEIAEKAGIGEKGTNNGVLLAIYVQEKKTRIEVGYGLEALLTDAESGRILRDQLGPAFRAGNYAAGISDALDRIEAETVGEAQPPPAKRRRRSDGPGIGVILLFLVLLLFFGGGGRVLLTLLGAPVTMGRRASKRHRSAWRGAGWGVGGWGGGGWGGGGGGGGGWGGGGGGGGYSGGGGSFGGGGASGGW